MGVPVTKALLSGVCTRAPRGWKLLVAPGNPVPLVLNTPQPVTHLDKRPHTFGTILNIRGLGVFKLHWGKGFYR